VHLTLFLALSLSPGNSKARKLAYYGDGDEQMGMGRGAGMEITSARTDGDGDRVERRRLGTDLNFTRTDGMFPAQGSTK